MNHLFKQNAIQELVKYNKCLLSVTILLAAANIIAIMAAITKEEKKNITYLEIAFNYCSIFNFNKTCIS
ncbi:hypothetical protein OTUT144_0697 [Orientia tsutsugamushi str. UT144]|uniref:Conjugal transfer protein TraE n=1 Tax=Orientia tsutsugamushi str. UT144 TaxID=1441384 RepID=A0A0F3RQ71_ORITS|nr:hypothetical protein [Orientia tsutsugamushi]KJW07264.1 hypothetical protein OTUT144_0697 [Orientia tsutsugamushi str. UT144]